MPIPGEIVEMIFSDLVKVDDFKESDKPLLLSSLQEIEPLILDLIGNFKKMPASEPFRMVEFGCGRNLLMFLVVYYSSLLLILSYLIGLVEVFEYIKTSESSMKNEAMKCGCNLRASARSISSRI